MATWPVCTAAPVVLIPSTGASHRTGAPTTAATGPASGRRLDGRGRHAAGRAGVRADCNTNRRRHRAARPSRRRARRDRTPGERGDTALRAQDPSRTKRPRVSSRRAPERHGLPSPSPPGARPSGWRTPARPQTATGGAATHPCRSRAGSARPTGGRRRRSAPSATRVPVHRRACPRWRHAFVLAPEANAQKLFALPASAAFQSETPPADAEEGQHAGSREEHERKQHDVHRHISTDAL